MFTPKLLDYLQRPAIKLILPKQSSLKQDDNYLLKSKYPATTYHAEVQQRYQHEQTLWLVIQHFH